MEPVTVWRSPKVDVRESHLGGLAVFANASIAKDEPVAVKVGHVVDYDEVERLTREIGDFSLQIAEGLFLSPRHADEYEAMVVHINHSCDANVGFEGNVTYVAVRDIDTNGVDQRNISSTALGMPWGFCSSQASCSGC